MTKSEKDDDAGGAFDPFAGGELSMTAPATEPQQEIWLAIELGGKQANLAYNESISLRVRGPLDGPAMEAALVALGARHEALRTTISSDGATLSIEAHPRVTVALDNLTSLADEAREGRRREIIREEVTTPFDLTRGPLFRPRLIRLAADDHEIVLTAHHIVCDGWSTGVLLSELPEMYAAVRAQRAPSLPEAPRFSDYAVNDRRGTHGDEAAEAERHWLGVLGSAPPTLDLPTDRPRLPERPLDAAREDWLLDKQLIDGLRDVGKRAQASLVATMMAALDAFLYRLTGQTDFVIGMPAAGQTTGDFSGLVGHCVNTLPIRVTCDPAAPFIDHVRAVKRSILDGFEHQRLSFGGLLRKIDLPRDPSRVPLIPVLFNLDRRTEPMHLGDALVEFISNPRAFENFELFLNGTETPQGVVLETTWNTRLWDRETILRWLEEFTLLLRGVCKAPETALGALPVLPEAERRRLVEVWNATAVPLPAEPTVVDLIEAQVRRTPNAVAVRDERGSLTYAELDRRANHIADRLRAVGVDKEHCVGVCVERSSRLLVALLGVWKAEAAYVPLDPDYPRARLDFVVDDAKLRAIVTERSLVDLVEGGSIERLLLDDEKGVRLEALPRSGDARLLAYVLHTSGSTGKPKGVQIEHRSLVNFLTSMAREPGLASTDVLVAVTTLSFDIAGLELFLPLVVGAQVVIATRETAMDGIKLGELIRTSGATVLQATPATWRLLIESDWRGGPGFKALCGGEALPLDLLGELLARTGSLFNVYGPTETTIWSTLARIDSAEPPVTIGRPIANTTTYLLDPAGQVVPTGTVGELYIGGLGVARGYLNRPDLTTERFVRDPFSSDPEARLYRTGDVARTDAKGRLFFERRNDGQVKVRGFRIELGDVESALAQHADVRQSAAVVRELGPGDTRLIGYVVPKPGVTLDMASLREHLQAIVPPYMVPQHLVPLEAIPLTPNGKIDRKALPAPDPSTAGHEQYVAPQTEIQTRLAEIWAELLRMHRVGIRDNFFEVGGHSMLAVRMLSRIRETLGVDLSLRIVFQAQSIEALSAHVEAALLMRKPGKGTTRDGETPREEVDF